MKLISRIMLFICLLSSIIFGQNAPEPYLRFQVFLAHGPDGGPLFTSPVMMDMNRDGYKEIIMNAHNKVFIVNKDGFPLPGWPQETTYRIQQNASIADIDGDDTLDVVVRDRGWGTSDHYLYAWNHRGELFPGFPVEAPLTTNQPKTPTLYDFNGDGAADILFNKENELVIIDHTGTPLSGWPVRLKARPRHYQLASLSGNDSIQILVQINSCDSLYIFNPDGSSFMKPVHLHIEDHFLSIFSAADVDRDGIAEIFAGMYKLGTFPPEEYAVALFSPFHGILPGWPQYFSTEYISQPCSWADLTGDGQLEIIWIDETSCLYVYNLNGQCLPGFPTRPYGSSSSVVDPVIGDIDGDGDLEIFVDNNLAFNDNSHYHVYHHTGEEVSWSPLVTPAITCFNSPALGDIDNDGSVEMALSIRDPYDWNVYLWVFTIPSVPFVSERFPWPMHAHDPQHTYWYDFQANSYNDITKPAIQHAEEFRLFANYPNPFNPVTHIEFSLPEPAQITLNIYDITGRLVEQLINQNTAAGYHTVSWNASRYSSGIYIARMQAGDFVKTQKMVLMK